MNTHEKINYAEFPSSDFAATKEFYAATFNWQFVDYGESYMAFTKDSAGLDGGFYQADLQSDASAGSALIVLYSEQLEATQEKIKKNGGKIVKDIFSFPGGRRFHFQDPVGNELAVWSDK